MYQIYLLSIVTLVLSGVALAYERLESTVRVGNLFNGETFANPTFRLILGVVTLLVGFFQFLSVAPGDVPVVGNLVPALTGVLLGVCLALEFYRARTDIESGFAANLDRLLLGNGSRLGVLGLVVAVLHFLFHRALFL